MLLLHQTETMRKGEANGGGGNHLVEGKGCSLKYGWSRASSPVMRCVGS